MKCARYDVVLFQGGRVGNGLDARLQRWKEAHPSAGIKENSASGRLVLMHPLLKSSGAAKPPQVKIVRMVSKVRGEKITVHFLDPDEVERCATDPKMHEVVINLKYYSPQAAIELRQALKCEFGILVRALRVGLVPVRKILVDGREAELRGIFARSFRYAAASRSAADVVAEAIDTQKDRLMRQLDATALRKREENSVRPYFLPYIAFLVLYDGAKEAQEERCYSNDVGTRMTLPTNKGT